MTKGTLKWQQDDDALWPAPLSEKALHGLAGDVVRTAEPYSEASRVAILTQFLSTFGASVETGPYAMVSDSRHSLRVWTILVGKTSKGRKGSSWAPIHRIFELADPEIVGRRMVNGLSSGEGIIWEVRDPLESFDARQAKKTTDPGVQDKRLFVLEEEFSSVLRVADRQGNTLSPVLRRAWGSGDLQILTKNSPARATGAHIVIVGHISKDELVRYLDRSEIANGFANRFLFICTQRERELPDGPSMPEEEVRTLADRVKQALEAAREIGEMRRDEEAAEVWRSIYGNLSEGKPGLLGGVTARAEAQALRLAMLYAALDGSSLIRLEHLLAGLAVWEYAFQSARWVFGDRLGHPLADDILQFLRANGSLTRNEIYQMWGKNRGKGPVHYVLSMLLKNGLAEVCYEDTGGRRTEVWKPKCVRRQRKW